MAPTQDVALTLKAKLFRGLADPSRLAIIETLRSGEKTVSAIVLETALSQPSASMHLHCLKDCGLVVSRQEGRRVYYRLADARTEDVLRTIEDILADIAATVYACTRYRSVEEDHGNHN